jgi:mycothiol system anti-sigma-R factor
LITCADAVKELWEYLDRELPENERARIEEHLNFCRTCCGELEFAEELQRFMRSRQSDEIPEDVRYRLESILSELKED